MNGVCRSGLIPIIGFMPVPPAPEPYDKFLLALLNNAVALHRLEPVKGLEGFIKGFSDVQKEIGEMLGCERHVDILHTRLYSFNAMIEQCYRSFSQPEGQTIEQRFVAARALGSTIRSLGPWLAHLLQRPESLFCYPLVSPLDLSFRHATLGYDRYLSDIQQQLEHLHSQWAHQGIACLMMSLKLSEDYLVTCLSKRICIQNPSPDRPSSTDTEKLISLHLRLFEFTGVMERLLLSLYCGTLYEGEFETGFTAIDEQITEIELLFKFDHELPLN
ncbi:hypothetical protein [Biostraticola tofi]|uniref:Uncharacterized protein n=1 Tax=Biostraticola tofi TaxID=466109 RepID=A0A4R3YYH7_9GAMM|nr:hypothetical protein [Biostraticola tofi]TCV98307.1 hypothetical protein EDC52_103399 [Biostraticola tofi]